MIYILIILCTIALFLLVIFRNHFFSSSYRKSEPCDEIIVENKKSKLPCILCGSSLVKGENLRSDEFKGEKDSIIHLYGCPYCSGEKDYRKRTCPICKREMKVGDYLVGRMWQRNNNKRHLHINGCNKCNKR